jgi:hypothetical protein
MGHQSAAAAPRQIRPLSCWVYGCSTCRLPPMPSEDEPGTIERMIRGSGFGSMRGFRLGPGTVGNLAVVAAVALGSCALAGWALSKEPLLATCTIGLILIFSAYFVERCFRFAERHPAEALMGGTEYFHYLRDQTAEKDRSIIIEAPAVIAGPPQIERSGSDE